MSTGSISSVSCFNMCILILCWPTTYLYIKILLSDPNFLITSLQRRSKILYEVIFVHLKNEKKLFFFFNKNVLSLRPQTGRDSFFLSFCGILSTFFSLMVWQNWLECVWNIPLHWARIILKLIILMFLMAASGSEMNSLYLSWSMYVIKQSRS